MAIGCSSGRRHPFKMCRMRTLHVAESKREATRMPNKIPWAAQTMNAAPACELPGRPRRQVRPAAHGRRPRRVVRKRSVVQSGAHDGKRRGRASRRKSSRATFSGISTPIGKRSSLCLRVRSCSRSRAASRCGCCSCSQPVHESALAKRRRIRLYRCRIGRGSGTPDILHQL